jgi:hypothetical protein
MWPFAKKRVIDFTSNQPPKIPNPNYPAAAQLQVQDSSGYVDASTDFFGAISTSASSTPASSKSSSSLDTQNLKVKIEDIEYKLDAMSRKINSLIDRVDLVEKKVARNERGYSG